MIEKFEKSHIVYINIIELEKPESFFNFINVSRNQVLKCDFTDLFLTNSFFTMSQCGNYENLLLLFFWQKFRENNDFTNKITK